MATPRRPACIHGAIEDFAQELALITRRFLKTKGWRDTERIVIGGGFRASRVGELAIGRAAVMLKADGIELDIAPIRNEPDEAGLLGAPQLAPAWMFQATTPCSASTSAAPISAPAWSRSI